MSKNVWTKQQQDAIDTTNKSVLVSAAAGSGKTAVLAERCVKLVTDPEIACDVDRLLVVTFTNDAAEEMRSRIEQTLRQRIASDVSDDRLEKQLFLLQRAQISTIHGFCNRVIQQHFHLLGLDPGMRLLQEEEASLMRTQLLRDLIHNRYGRANPTDFENLLEWYFDGNDERLIGVILRLYHLLTSVIDPRAWARDARNQLRDALADFSNSDLAKRLAKIITRELKTLIDDCDAYVDRFSEHAALANYHSCAKEVKSEAMARIALAEKADFDTLSQVCAQYAPDNVKAVRGVDAAIREPAKKALDDLRECFKKGKLSSLCAYSASAWIAGLQTTEKSLIQLLTLTRQFARAYQKAKRAIRSLDFSDLERYALQILRNHPEVGKQCREQFCHVLVDEFQDINDVQEAILKLVSREQSDDESLNANLFTVGDVKQSIYRFRLADPTLFLRRHELFRTKPSSRRKAIDLQANFRSRAPLLQAINLVFERLMTRETADIDYDDSHKLTPGATYPFAPETNFAGVPVELHLLQQPPRGGDEDTASDALDELDRTEREAVFIANRIQQLISRNPAMQVYDRREGKMVPRNLSYKDIVILMRSRQYKAQQMSEQLQKAGIPVHADTGNGFFESIEMRDVISLLRLLDNQQQDIPMAAVLRSPFASLDHADDALAKIRMRYRGDEVIPFHRAVVRYIEDAGDALARTLEKFFDRVKHWRDLAHRKPLAEVIALIYNESGYLTWCAGLPNGRQRVANLLDLLERAKQFGSFQRQGLGRFLEFLQKLEEESDLGQPSLLGEGEDAVRILTIHRSKGLEFPVVFVADLGKGHNFQDEKSSILAERDEKLALDAVDIDKRIRYPSASSVVVLDRLHNTAIAEELRVLYVAMTRAKEHLILVGTCDFDQVEKWKDRWAGWQGAMPAANVPAGRTFLHWLVPSAFAINSVHPGTFDLQQHSLTDLDSLAQQRVKQQQGDIDDTLCNLKPLHPAPSLTDTTRTVIARLSAKYPFEEFTKISATQAVTSIAKQQIDVPPPTARDRLKQSSQTLLMPPRFVGGMKAPSAADEGTATHLVLQHLDFFAAGKLDQIESQIASMIQRRLLLPEEAELVDRQTILWLMATTTGSDLKQYRNELKRELPIYFSQPVNGSTGLDRVMVRGRIDVLIPARDGLILVDYKTDRVNATTIVTKAESYAPQLRLYGSAIQAITDQKIIDRRVVFLSAREVRSV